MPSFVYSFLSFFLFARFALSDVPLFSNDEDYQFSRYGPYPRQRFFSDPDVIAPVPNVIVPPQEGVSANEFVTWSPHGDGVPVHGPQLLDADTLSVVYQGPAFAEDNFGISVQSCNGSDYMVWWSGTNINGRAAGHFYIMNSTYHSVWNVSSIGLKLADAHDIFLTPDCHAIITVYEPKPYELQDWHLEDNSWLLDSYLQEIDLATNELVFQWRASDHIDLHDSRWFPQIAGWDHGWQGVNRDNAWDFFHINSVEKDWRGNYLLSARHTNALYYLDGITGAVKWTLGGKKNDFRDMSNGYATDFAWQHHARWADKELTTISVFDDRSCRYIQSSDPISRGALIRLDFDAMTATLVHNYRAPSQIAAFRKGSMQVLPNANVILGFGNQPAFTEYAANGTILWDVKMGPVMAGYDRETADNYRSLKVDWVGRPWWGPKIGAGPVVGNATDTMDFANGSVKSWEGVRNETVYLSWNGATEVKRWMTFAGDHPLELDDMAALFATVNKTGFETGMFVGDDSNSTRYIRAVALNKDDDMMQATPILDMQTGKTYAHAREFLMGQQHNWWDDTRDSEWDTVVDEELEDADTLKSLRQQWDNQRFKAQRQRKAMGLAVLALLGFFAVLAWVGWRQLRQAAGTRYRGLGKGVDVEAARAKKEKIVDEHTRLRADEDEDEENGSDGEQVGEDGEKARQRKRFWIGWWQV